MLLRQVNMIGREGLTDIQIRKDQIQEVYSTGSRPHQGDPFLLLFNGAIAFPGLINSHDHLDFNLFSQTGNKIYSNYKEWGRDIHAVNEKEIDRILLVPLPLRVKWGIYKNLLNGVTTVVNHGKRLEIKDDLITVYQGSRSLHSTAFEKNWRWKINSPFAGNRPFVIHLGEGTDRFSGLEIDRLIKWNIFKRKVIAIHGVAMNRKQASAFRALVWCPASNYFLLNRTAPVNLLRGQVKIMLGTDSTLTASWNLWEQLRLARKETMISDRGLLDMLCRIPAKTWGFDHCGSIEAGRQADLVIADGPDKMTGMDRFYSLNPQDLLLVLHKGNIRLFDISLLEQLSAAGFSGTGFSKILVNGKMKYVEGDLPGLMRDIRKYCPSVKFPVSAF
jgi:cytosine/adenosine deaminase-related metal-dependent hydrolase